MSGIAKDVATVLQILAEAAAERFRENEAEIARLRADVETLKRERENEQRQSLIQKLRSKGIIGP